MSCNAVCSKCVHNGSAQQTTGEKKLNTLLLYADEQRQENADLYGFIKTPKYAR